MADAGSDSDDNKPVAALVARRLSSSSAQSSSTTVIGEASDSEDDLPIVQLIAKRQREGKLDEFMKKKKKAVNDSSKKREEDKNGSKTSNTSRPISRPGNTNASSSAEFYSSPKGQLVQNILSRWWYAIEWPRPEHIGKPPPGFETLDGFPGVFVSTSVSTGSSRELFHHKDLNKIAINLIFTYHFYIVNLLD